MKEASHLESDEPVWQVQLPGKIEFTPAMGSAGLLVIAGDAIWRLGMAVMPQCSPTAIPIEA